MKTQFMFIIGIIIIRFALGLDRPVSASSNSLFQRSSKSSSSMWFTIQHYFGILLLFILVTLYVQ